MSDDSDKKTLMESIEPSMVLQSVPRRFDVNSFRDVYPLKSDEDPQYIINEIGTTKYSPSDDFPGFEPPGFVRASYLIMWSLYILTILSIFAAVFQFGANVLFNFTPTYHIKGNQVSLLLILVALYIGLVFLTAIYKKIHQFIKEPYIQEYKKWLDEINCNNDAYLPSHIHRKASGIKYNPSNIPRSAPVELRDNIYLWERFWFGIGTLLKLFIIIAFPTMVPKQMLKQVKDS